MNITSFAFKFINQIELARRLLALLPWVGRGLSRSASAQASAISCHGRRVPMRTHEKRGRVLSSLLLAGYLILAGVDAGFAQQYFGRAKNFDVGDEPRAIAVGDLNGDGFSDLAVANSASSPSGRSVSVLLGNGAGAFKSPIVYDLPVDSKRPSSLAIGDLDSDGQLDLVVGNFSSANVSVLLGDGQGSFTSVTNIDVPGDPESLIQSVAVGDFDCDTALDLVVATSESYPSSGVIGLNSVAILLGNGMGSFIPHAIVALSFFPKSVAVGDLTSFAGVDLAVAGFVLGVDVGAVSVLQGNCTGYFTASGGSPFLTAPVDGYYAVAIGDVDNDGYNDLVAVGELVSVFTGDGTGHLAGPADFGGGPILSLDCPGGMCGSDIAIDDLDLDGDVDVAVANYGTASFPGATVSILEGDGNGSFSLPEVFLVGEIPTSLEVADFDGDNRPDLAVANGLSDDVSVLRNVAPGDVSAWGAEGPGQSGDVASPGAVGSLLEVVSVDGGFLHGLAVTADGSVWAWGENGEGQLGDNTTNYSSAPVQVMGLPPVATVAARAHHSLALTRPGEVWAWGKNKFGAVGNGTTANQQSPVLVSIPSDIAAIAAGANHSLAVDSNEGVWAWGRNNYGQLGNGCTSAPSCTPSTTPALVSSLSNVVTVAAGGRHSLALRRDGTVYAWGVGTVPVNWAITAPPVAVCPFLCSSIVCLLAWKWWPSRRELPTAWLWTHLVTSGPGAITPTANLAMEPSTIRS